MARFNQTEKTGLRSPVKAATSEPDTSTFEGADAYYRDEKSALFVLGAGRFWGTDSFYESGNDAADRFRNLIHEVTAVDPSWVARFLKWLRSEANIRTAALVGAAEYVKATQSMVNLDVFTKDGLTARAVVRSVLQRADEPGEILAYWTKTHGRSIPIALKRGVTDAIVGHKTDRGPLYTEYSSLKYDTSSKNFRFGDVIELTHPTGEHPDIKGTKQGRLFKWLIDRRHGSDDLDTHLPMTVYNHQARKTAQESPEYLLNPEVLDASGMTWEDVLSLVGHRLSKAHIWESLLDANAIGYMAMLRNLRNFDEAGISKSHVKRVAMTLEDPERVAKSRQLPFRFWSAYKETGSLRYSQALEEALDLSVHNVPELRGRTLVLVDMSGSMQSRLSGRSSVTYAEVAALFGNALGQRGAVTLIGFASDYFEQKVKPGGSVLRGMQDLLSQQGSVGYDTYAERAARENYNGHDRVVLLSDMQVADQVDTAIPKNVPLYSWNLAGYAATATPVGKLNRHEFGGFSDKAFSIMQTLEQGQHADWPF